MMYLYVGTLHEMSVLLVSWERHCVCDLFRLHKDKQGKQKRLNPEQLVSIRQYGYVLVVLLQSITLPTPCTRDLAKPFLLPWTTFLIGVRPCVCTGVVVFTSWVMKNSSFVIKSVFFLFPILIVAIIFKIYYIQNIICCET